MSTERRALSIRPNTRTLIAFATRWGAQFGGINSFNLDMISAFAAAFYEKVKTICVVLHAERHEYESALNEQVHLVSLNIPDQKNFSKELEDLVWRKLQELELHLNCDHAVWLGHDRITGEIAIESAKKRGGRSALIHHMSYSRYESFAENSKTSKDKENEQRKLFNTADLVMAIGPLLSDSLSDMRNNQDIITLIPGLPDITVRNSPKIFKGFLSGRLSEDASKIKQAHLGVASFADSIRQSDENSGLPSSLRGENEPALILRGVDFEKTHIENLSDVEHELKIFAEDYAGRMFNLQALPFTTDRKELFEDLSRASVAMMPSWHEGFGLVAWEAIAAGVPLIVSKKSGVFRLLSSFNDGLYTSCVIPIDVAGSSSPPYFLARDVTELAQALISVAKDPQTARQKAARLREAFISKFTWADCARQMANHFGWQTIEHLTNPSEETINSRPSIEEPNIIFLDLPVPRWSATAGLSISQLLRPEEAIIPFDQKRSPFLKLQLDWTASAYPIAVRLLTGAGGVGKTRLALEMCLQLTSQGWHAGFLLSDCGIEQGEQFAQQLVMVNRPCCVVIDYAETRQAVLLVILSALLKANVTNPVRILLLARDGGEWWTALPSKEASCEALLEGDACSGPYILPQLHDSLIERELAYFTALHTFSDLLKIAPDQHIPNMADAYFSRPLYVQMAALMALRGERPRSAESLQRAVVNHEKRYWGKILSINPSDSIEYEHQAALLMTFATFANGVTTERSIENAWKAAGENKSKLRRIFTSLSSLYPDRQGLQGLRPDLIGEALVAQSLLTSNGPRILDIVLSGDKRLRRSSLTILARLLRNRADLASLVEDALSRRFVICIDEVIAVCIETPSPLPELFQSAYENLKKPEKLQAAGILDKRLHHEVLQLTSLDVLVSKTIADKRSDQAKRNREEDIVNYATALNNLSVALYRDGKSDQALASARQAVEIHRKFKNPKTLSFKSCLASSLLTFAIRLEELGQSDDALTAATESIEIYRHLNKAPLQPYNFELASAIISFAKSLSSLGRNDEAIIAAKESLDIYQALNHESHDGLTDRIATALNNYATYLDSEGRTDEAAETAKKTMDLSLELATSSPNRFQAKYAMTLYNYSEYLSAQGKITEAISSCEQALRIYRDLAEARPDRFESNLARVIRGYGERLYDAGRFQDSLAEFKKSLNICRNLADANPIRSKAELTFSLIWHAQGLANIGTYNEAIYNIEEAIDSLDELVKINPGYYLAELEHRRLDKLFWRWLSTRDYQIEDIQSNLQDIKNINSRKSVEFHQMWLAACLKKDTESILSTLKFFTSLNSSQQRAAIAKLFILVKLYMSLSRKNEPPQQLHDILKTYLKKTNGVFPHWLIEISNKYDFSI